MTAELHSGKQYALFNQRLVLCRYMHKAVYVETENLCNEESQNSHAGITWTETSHTFFSALSIGSLLFLAS